MTYISARVGKSTYPVCVSENALDQLLDFCSNYIAGNIVVIADECFLMFFFILGS